MIVRADALLKTMIYWARSLETRADGTQVVEIGSQLYLYRRGA